MNEYVARRRERIRTPQRDGEGYLQISIPAILASGAHQMSEEAELIVYLVARALDVAGSGRVLQLDVQREMRHMFKGGKLWRVFERPGGGRYWSIDRGYLHLQGQTAIVESFACELVTLLETREFSLRYLDSRPRRNAAVFAPVLGTDGSPRSNLFIHKFSRVDRKTLASWARDPVIVEHILRKMPPEWVS